MNTPKTVHLVPLSVLTDLARLGLAMRRAQRDFFEARKKNPGVRSDVEFREAKDAERRFDTAVRDALARERVSLPGLEGGEQVG